MKVLIDTRYLEVHLKGTDGHWYRLVCHYGEQNCMLHITRHEGVFWDAERERMAACPNGLALGPCQNGVALFNYPSPPELIPARHHLALACLQVAYVFSAATDHDHHYAGELVAPLFRRAAQLKREQLAK